jgi:hypothetical protein
MRNIAPPTLLATLLIAMCITLAAVAATIALVRPAHAQLEADLRSHLSADYSPNSGQRPLAPLDRRIVEIARDDESRLNSDTEAEIVHVFYVTPPDPNDETTPEDIFVTPPPTPTPEPPGATPVPTAPTSLTRTPTPGPGETPRPTATATPGPGPTLPPGATPTPTPKPATPTPSPAPTPTPTPPPTQPPTPTPTPPPVPSWALYFHHNPSPPTGNSTSQPISPCNGTAPAPGTLYNYDTEYDLGPGRHVAKGGSGPDEVDGAKYQAWRTGPLASNFTLSGNVRVELWTAMENFAVGTAGTARVYVRDISGGAPVIIAQGVTVVSSATPGWVYRSVSLSTAGYTVPSGHELEVKIIVLNSSNDDLIFAYDTAAYPSRIAGY